MSKLFSGKIDKFKEPPPLGWKAGIIVPLPESSQWKRVIFFPDNFNFFFLIIIIAVAAAVVVAAF